VALLQLVRVYTQAMARVADAEVRLFHLYVHEPLMRSGATGVETAEQMHALSREVLPLAGPILDQVHQRYLQHFVEQDVVGHMEADLGGSSIDLGRLRVAIAFADLAGYTRLTEEEGELTAVDAVERFVDAVEASLPDDARVIKTIGDEAMVIGADPVGLVDWAVAFQAQPRERPRPRIAVHYGVALYRDGDYYGRDVNIASRVAARSAGGEVLVTRPVVEQVGRAGGGVSFERIGEVRLKGFTDPTELFLASTPAQLSGRR
jgi:adenylate cyclase